MPFRISTPSVKLGPIRFRFGKKGVSVSTRSKYGSVTSGPNGTRMSVRIAPGISYQQRLDQPSANRPQLTPSILATSTNDPIGKGASARERAKRGIALGTLSASVGVSIELLTALECNPLDAEAWFLLGTIPSEEPERRYCLQMANALRPLEIEYRAAFNALGSGSTSRPLRLSAYAEHMAQNAIAPSLPKGRVMSPVWLLVMFVGLTLVVIVLYILTKLG